MTTAFEIPAQRIDDDGDIDPTIAALLRGKALDDPVPAGVWWLCAELLRSTILVNDLLVGTGRVPSSRLGEAELFADLALDELHAATGIGGMPSPVAHQNGAVASLTVAAGIRRSALPLARLLLTQGPTDPRVLATALGRHRRTLSRCRPLAVRLSVSSPA